MSTLLRANVNSGRNTKGLAQHIAKAQGAAASSWRAVASYVACVPRQPPPSLEPARRVRFPADSGL